jgi:peptidoglycan/xylan/chitin deacetylase (PgdA/CDA1 family)
LNRKKFKVLIIATAGICLVFFIIVYIGILDSIKILTLQPDSHLFRASNKLTESAKQKKVITAETIELPIIMYHYVEYLNDNNDLTKAKLTISPDIFENQLSTLQKNRYTTCYAVDIPSLIKNYNNHSSKIVVLTFDDGYEDFYLNVFPLLKKYQVKATVFIIYNAINKNGYLNDDQIKEMIASGLVEIGSHTLDHLYLAKIPRDKMVIEVNNSKLELERKFGIIINSFAYPYGSFDHDVMEQVKKSGYTVAVSVINGHKQSPENIFFLSRIRAGSFFGKEMIKVL